MEEKLGNNTNSHNPKISVGIPVYNGEKFIRKSIESVLQQTYGNFELIISDNASTDSTSDVCTEFLTKDSRIKFEYLKKGPNMFTIRRECLHTYLKHIK